MTGIRVFRIIRPYFYLKTQKKHFKNFNNFILISKHPQITHSENKKSNKNIFMNPGLIFLAILKGKTTILSLK